MVLEIDKIKANIRIIKRYAYSFLFFPSLTLKLRYISKNDATKTKLANILGVDVKALALPIVPKYG
jgi:hypothetical protein